MAYCVDGLGLDRLLRCGLGGSVELDILGALSTPNPTFKTPILLAFAVSSMAPDSKKALT